MKWLYPLIIRMFTARPNNLLYSSIWMAIYQPLLGTNSLLSSVIVPDQPNSPAVRLRGYINTQQIMDIRMWDTCYVSWRWRTLSHIELKESSFFFFSPHVRCLKKCPKRQFRPSHLWRKMTLLARVNILSAVFSERARGGKLCLTLPGKS